MRRIESEFYEEMAKEVKKIKQQLRCRDLIQGMLCSYALSVDLPGTDSFVRVQTILTMY